jgi:hypothetical protein
MKKFHNCLSMRFYQWQVADMFRDALTLAHIRFKRIQRSYQTTRYEIRNCWDSRGKGLRAKTETLLLRMWMVLEWGNALLEKP